MDFIAEYIEYNKETEPPYIYHRWSAIAGISALLGRSFWLQHGQFRIFPNLYCMLIGDPAARKSTAIKIMKNKMFDAGYECFAADKTTKEKFLLDLEGATDEEIAAADGNRQNKKVAYDAIMAENLWGKNETSLSEPKEVFIAADEWTEFAKPGDTEFYTTLGNLWDWDNEKRPFTQRVKNSKSVSIFQPTVSILAGNTPELFSKAFPPDIIGTGFLSRMILIHGERSGRKYPFPPMPSQESTNAILKRIQAIRSTAHGAAKISEEASRMLSSIYYEWPEIDDVRFKSYSNRRYTQLLKLCLITTAARGNDTISSNDVIYANTTLSAVELLLPKALGEFGKSKNSDVANKIMSVLNAAMRAQTARDLWKHVHKDLEKISMLSDILNGLMTAGKIQHVKEGGGWLPLNAVKKQPIYVDWEHLTEEERGKI